MICHYSPLISLTSLIYLSQQKHFDRTRKFALTKLKSSITSRLSQEIELSIHCEVLWFITADGRRPGEGDYSDGALQGELDETHFPRS